MSSRSETPREQPGAAARVAGDITAADLAAALAEARRLTLSLVEDIDGSRWLGERLPIVNPFLWEIGHVAWFQERWTLRRHGAGALLDHADRLYDSAAVAHDTRWDLPLPAPGETRAYLARVLDRVLERLAVTGAAALDPEDSYFHQLALFHEDMHAEALCYSRQTLGYPAPPMAHAKQIQGQALPGDVSVPGGPFLLGARRGGSTFVFDNEQWAHAVELKPFRIARAPVTNTQFAQFVADGGYRRTEFWSQAGADWRERTGATHPVYWLPQGGGEWGVRRYDQVVELAPHEPVVHVCWYEAEAWCRWAGRRLATEAEWEMAAASATAGGSGDAVTPAKRPFPWGETLATPACANLDGAGGGIHPVSNCDDGDSVFGCRQMLGNVWEWTADDFLPYPGFKPGPYREYSEPWFGTHKVLRGGCWFTRARLVHNTWRNFYTPERRDVWCGFRTCAL